MVKALRVVGLAWCYGVGLVILASLAIIAYRDGFGEVQEIMSPFNITNAIVTALALAPGAFCLWASDKLRDRQRLRTSTDQR